MSAADLHRFPMSSPNDFAPLEAAIKSGQIAPQHIAAILCKTEGNGLGNDWTRAYVDLQLRTLLGQDRGAPAMPLILVSGGSEGVVSPHCLVLTRMPGPGTGGLCLGSAARRIDHRAIGHQGQIDLTAQMVTEAMAQAGLDDASQVGLVIVRAPSAIDMPEGDARARAASALGAAVALREVDPAQASEAAILAQFDLFCSRVFTVARSDTDIQQVVVLGNGPHGNPALRIAGGTLADPLDAPGVARLLCRLGVEASPQASPGDSARILCAIVKGDAPGGGFIRGARHVMAIDSDIAVHRHARAAYGAMVSAVIGHSYCFAGAGAEHQGPPDGGLAALILCTYQEEQK